MKCDDFLLYSSLYLDNDLDDVLRLEFENHLEDCVNCKDEFESLIIAFNDLKDFSSLDTETQFPADLHDNVMKAVKAANSKNIIFLYGKKAKALVAAAIIFISVFSLNDMLQTGNQQFITSVEEAASLDMALLENETEEVAYNGQNEALNTQSALGVEGDVEGVLDGNALVGDGINSLTGEASLAANEGIKESISQNEAIVAMDAPLEDTIVFPNSSEQPGSSSMKSSLNTVDLYDIGDTPVYDRENGEPNEMQEMIMAEGDSAVDTSFQARAFSMPMEDMSVVTIPLTETSLYKISHIFNEYSIQWEYFQDGTPIAFEDVLQYDNVNAVITINQLQYEEILPKFMEIKNEFTGNNKVIAITIKVAS